MRHLLPYAMSSNCIYMKPPICVGFEMGNWGAKSSQYITLVSVNAVPCWEKGRYKTGIFGSAKTTSARQN